MTIGQVQRASARRTSTAARCALASPAGRVVSSREVSASRTIRGAPSRRGPWASRTIRPRSSGAAGTSSGSYSSPSSAARRSNASRELPQVRQCSSRAASAPSQGESSSLAPPNRCGAPIGRPAPVRGLHSMPWSSVGSIRRAARPIRATSAAGSNSAAVTHTWRPPPGPEAATTHPRPASSSSRSSAARSGPTSPRPPSKSNSTHLKRPNALARCTAHGPAGGASGNGTER